MTVEAWFRRLTAGRAGSDAPGSRLRRWLRLLAGCLLLGAIAFNTSPGEVIAETKLDMAVNPVGFLERAGHLWDDAFFGHLQNQAYGYLFPMGPFYALFRWLDMPAWNIQRLWMTLVLCAAFLGVERLARALRIGSPGTRLLAGLTYALAPHALALVGVNSSEFQPSAVLPWILLPLVHGAEGSIGPRRAAAMSAVAFLFAGGINAAAELAVLVVPLLYLLTRENGPRKRRLLLWWLTCVVAVSMWWLVPLVVLGRYIFSFLPFIETASATTGVTSLLNTLRGTSSWISFLPVDGRPWLPAAYDQATLPWLIVVTAAVAALGLAGLIRRSTPERTFLALSVLAGIMIVSAGHADALAFPWSEQVRNLLDGPLAPFRNLHKFDALLRLPLALGLAALLTWRPHPIRLGPTLWRPQAFRLGLAAVTTGLAGLAVLPVATAGITPAGAFTDLPSYWRDAATWLNANTGHGMVLAVPGSKRGEYLWGRPLDEPMQSLLTVRWATHSNVPWGSAGLARLLQAVDERFSNGEGSEGLTTTLRRIGVKYLLVRNDLARDTIGSAWPARVHQTLEDSTGLVRVAQFGPLVGQISNTTASNWFDQAYPALEVYAVPDPAPIAGIVPTGATLRMAGAPEGVLAMAEQGVLKDDAPVLVGDEPGAAAVPARKTVATDTLRRRRMVFGDVRRSAGPTLAEGAKQDATTDLLDPAWTSATSSARYLGIDDVRASSSDADINAAAGERDPGRLPYAAFDGDTRTGWRSDGWNGALGEWLETRFVEPVRMKDITIAFEQGPIGPPVAEVELSTATGTRRVAVRQTPDPQLFTPPQGPTTWLRIKVTKLAYQPKNPFGGRVGITEVAIPGVRPARAIAAPGLPGGADAGTVLLTAQGKAPACMRGSSAWTCSRRLEILGEDGYGFQRLFAVNKEQTRIVSGTAVLTDPRSATLLTTLPNDYPHVSASSTITDYPAVLGRAAMDGDVRTLWYAQPFDRHPTLSIDLGRARRFSEIKVLFPDSFLGKPPVKVTIRAGSRTVQAWVGGDGRVAFPALTTRRLDIEFTGPASRSIEVTEITIPGVKPLGQLGGFPLRLPCGYGPTLEVDGTTVPTRIVGGTLNDVLNGRPLNYAGCQPVRLIPGMTYVDASSTDAFRVRSVVLRGEPAADAGTTRVQPARVEAWGPEERRLTVTASERSYLTVNENYNAGWHAYLKGAQLTPVRLDGWRQAWILPAGSGTVVLRYEPDATYRLSLLVGLSLILAVLVLAWVRGRRANRPPPVGPGRVTARWIWLAAPLAGLWTGGLAGAVLVPALTVVGLWLPRVLAARHADGGRPRRAARAALSSWVPAAALVLAGLSAAVGTVLGVEQLTGLVPQLCCLVVIVRLLVAVPAPERLRGPAALPDPRERQPVEVPG
ncbi:alpha-(1-_3)-arabinofuranosyltransferase domain-containing protein [Sphaerisporangium perillae]|uniref:alpha-(1->3)-arabinofuranosyltransferase domain-containing protein n=1 Tax=Sphaerisporangium perillae TaxID=2935860 RepID=UPI00200C4D80|nr:alpha-(1->3)-arabinofuranosyltransferase family protein [Sphaerisporangium perillae]